MATARETDLAFRRVLAVDDDPVSLALVRAALVAGGFEVEAVANGRAALDSIRARGLPHLAVVDLLMPVLDGPAFCRAVKEFCDLPMIILTSVDQTERVVEALDQYAEDYIVKPFHPEELTARVRRVLRRFGDFSFAAAPEAQHGPELSVDFARQRATVRGRPVQLTHTESKLLYLLLRGAGRVLTAEYLLGRLWPTAEVHQDALRVHIHRLRRKLEPDPERPAFIRTERGAGYCFPRLA